MIMNRYNQAPHPTQDTIYEKDNNTRKIFNLIQRSAFSKQVIVRLQETYVAA